MLGYRPFYDDAFDGKAMLAPSSVWTLCGHRMRCPDIIITSPMVEASRASYSSGRAIAFSMNGPDWQWRTMNRISKRLLIAVPTRPSISLAMMKDERKRHLELLDKARGQWLPLESTSCSPMGSQCLISNWEESANRLIHRHRRAVFRQSLGLTH